MAQVAERQQTGRGTPDHWLEAAHAVLVESGVDQVRPGLLAERLGLSRTSFYGHFDSRDDLLAALVERWQQKNTANLIARCDAYADSLAEALFNLFDCWLSPDLFDAGLDVAVRNWALGDAALRDLLEQNDRARLVAITALFTRFGQPPDLAEVRALTVYYTQIGYIAMMVQEPAELRIARMPLYIQTFSGVAPTEAEIARFRARHGLKDA